MVLDEDRWVTIAGLPKDRAVRLVFLVLLVGMGSVDIHPGSASRGGGHSL